MAKRRDTSRGGLLGPVRWDLLLTIKFPRSITIWRSTEERADRLKVGSVVVRAAGHELIEERRGTKQQEAEGTEVKVLVL